jgi:hypothetical protein
MALTTFVSGQVLTAQQLNDSFAAVGGLRLIKTQTIGSAVSSVTVSDAFSSTYDNYRVMISGGVSSATNTLDLTLGSTTTGYYYSGAYVTYAATTVLGLRASNSTRFPYGGTGTTNMIFGDVTILSPNLAKNTGFSTVIPFAATTEANFMAGGYLADTTQYTAFTLTASTGTITGGTIRVYGYQNS